jgi:hypothetical protein
MNPNYAQRVREDLDKLLNAQFIFPLKLLNGIIAYNCTEEKWQIMHLCGLLKIEFTNQEKSISITFFGFGIGYSCWI